MTLTRYPLRRGTATAIMLEYEDAQGERSMRQVMPVAIITDEVRRSNTSTYLHARCSIAKALRAFRFDRIESLSDPVSGEVSAATDWLSTVQLGEGRAFAWSDDNDIPDFGPHEPASASTATPVRSRWKAVLIGVLLGYLVGRLRLVAMVLHYLRVRHALWL